MERLYYQNQCVKIYYEDEFDAGLARWEGFVSGNDYRDALIATNALFKEMHTGKWVANFSAIDAITPEDKRWSDEVWFPEAISSGLRKIAIVVSKDNYEKMTEEDKTCQITQRNIISKYFDSETKALAWIASESDN